MSKAHELSEIFGDASMNYAEFSAKAAGLGITFGDIGAVKAEYEGKLAGIRRQNALEKELENTKVKNRALVSRLIDMDKVTVGEDGVTGIAEQLAALKTSDPYLFEDEVSAVPNPGISANPLDSANPVNPSNPANPVSAPAMRFSSGYSHGLGGLDPEGMSDAEFYKVVKQL